MTVPETVAAAAAAAATSAGANGLMPAANLVHRHEALAQAVTSHKRRFGKHGPSLTIQTSPHPPELGACQLSQICPLEALIFPPGIVRQLVLPAGLPEPRNFRHPPATC